MAKAKTPKRQGETAAAGGTTPRALANCGAEGVSPPSYQVRMDVFAEKSQNFHSSRNQPLSYASVAHIWREHGANGLPRRPPDLTFTLLVTPQGTTSSYYAEVKDW